MNHLKAVAVGMAAAALALVFVWLLSAAALSMHISQRMAEGSKDFSVPLGLVQLLLPIPVLAAAVGFWVGFLFMVRRQRGLPKT